MGAREEQIARIQQIERIQALEAKNIDPNQPGVEAIGTTGTVSNEPDWIDHAGAIAKKALPAPLKLMLQSHEIPAVRALDQGLGKVAGYAGGWTRTLAAKLAGMVKPGKNPVELLGSDGIKALQGEAPGTGDYAERFGVPTVSAQIPGTKRVLTSKDFLNVVGNAALDPLTYGGAQWAGKKLYNSAIRPVEIDGMRYGKADVGDVMNKHGIWNERDLPKKAQAVVDKNMASTQATEKAATLAGAEADIVESMQAAQAKVNQIREHARPGSAQEQMANEMQAEIDNHLATKAKPSETVFKAKPEDTSGFDAPTMGKIDRAGTMDPLELFNGKPKKGISQIRPVLAIEKPPTERTWPKGELPNGEGEIPGGPSYDQKNPSNRAPTDTSLKGWVKPRSDVDAPSSLPVQGEWTTTPAQPGPNPEATSTWKTDAYKAAKGAYDTTKHATDWQEFYKAQGYGLKEATEKAIEKTLGAEAAAKYRLENEEAGKLLSTGKAQKRVADQAARDMDTLTTTSNTEALLSGVAGIHGLEKALKAVSISKAVRGLKMSRMPIGYALRNLPKETTRGAALGVQLNPWSQPEEK